VPAFPAVRLKRPQHSAAPALLALGFVLCLAGGLPLLAETVKSKEVSSKPPTIAARLSEDPGKVMPDPAPAKNGEADPALCVKSDGAPKSTANASEPRDGSPVVSGQATAKSSDLDSGAQSTPDHSSSEMITDKLKLSLEPKTKTDSASEPAAQCGREENGIQAREKEDAPSN
jgi:hypothetical protein